MTQEAYQNYLKILQEELVPALGCTEPIAIAFAAAKARDVLGMLPDRIVVECSGNIIKNVKGVIVPATKNLRGMEAAAIIGIVGGDPSKGLEVLSSVSERHLAVAKEWLSRGGCETKWLDSPAKLHIIARLFAGEHSAMVEIIHSHTNIVHVEKDGKVLTDIPHSEEEDSQQTDYDCLNISDICDFARTVKIDDVKEILDRQIQDNTSISQEGLKNSYGACVGKTLIDAYGSDIEVRARAAAAAGSDARMSGCELPVVINSGSGNQGMTVSLPVIEYAGELRAGQEKLYRALCISNLTAIHIKSRMGRLSAFCGAVSAAAGAGAAIAYLKGGDEAVISQTIVNTLGNVSGIVCDGAKPSCAAKIASSLDAAILGCAMAMKQRGFRPEEGLIKPTIEETIASITRMAKDGMQTTDEEILRIMVGA